MKRRKEVLLLLLLLLLQSDTLDHRETSFLMIKKRMVMGVMLQTMRVVMKSTRTERMPTDSNMSVVVIRTCSP